MKRQFSISKYGFTMVEILIVLALFGMFIAATNTFDYKPSTDIEKVNRLKYAISDKLRDEILKVTIGRMPLNDGRISTNTVITVGTGGMITNYTNSGGTIFSTGYFIPPYYDNDKVYSFTGVAWYTGSTSSTTPWNGTGKIIITQNGITFSGTNNDNGNVILKINAGYGARSRWIELDRRTGKISIQS